MTHKTTYHCDRCRLEISEADMRKVAIDIESVDGSTVYGNSRTDELCAECVSDLIHWVKTQVLRNSSGPTCFHSMRGSCEKCS